MSIEVPEVPTLIWPPRAPFREDVLHYEDMLDCYAGNHFGRHQAAQPLRYAVAFGCYDREQMLADLGPDVHPVEHMRVTYRTILSNLALRGFDEWSQADLDAVSTAALVHDVGENTHPWLAAECGGVVGDKAQGTKTPDNEALEIRVRQALYAREFPWLLEDEAFLQRVEGLITHTEDSPVHDTLLESHDANTLRVGLRAGELALAYAKNGFTSEWQQDLTQLAKPVTSAAVARLEPRAAASPYVARTLEEVLPLYERIQTELQA